MTGCKLHIALKYRSLLIFDSNNAVRRKAVSLVNNPIFEAIILVAIIISSCLAGTTRTQAVLACDILLNSLFFFEFLIKIVSFGLSFHPHSYLRDPLNALDAAIVLTGKVLILDYRLQIRLNLIPTHIRIEECVNSIIL